MKVILTTLNAKYIHSSLAIRSLAAYCRQTADNIDIREYTINHEMLDIVSDLYRARPDMIGIACYIWNIRMSLELAAILKKVMPDVIIILGGPEVSYDPGQIMTEHLCIDYIIMGEGEETLQALLKHVEEKSAVDGIAGLVYRDSGEIVISGGPQVVQSLDKLPFAYSQQDLLELKDKIIYYESSRGCPFSCQYCLSSATAGVRFLSEDRILEDLRILVSHDVRQVKFVDRTFNTKKEHYLPILRFLSEVECRTNFHFEVAADYLDEAAVTIFKQAASGRFQLEIGVQSTYEPTLEAICRKNNWAKIVNNVSRLRERDNIHLHLDLIVGLPYENWERFAQSFNAVYSLQPHMLQIGFLKMLKGSGVRQSAKQHGYVWMDHAPYEVLSNDYLNYGEIRFMKVIEKVFNQVYNSGRFQYTLKWMVHELFGGNAFTFYQSLAEYWEDCALYLVSHGPKAIFRILADFCGKISPNMLDTCLEFLKFDSLLNDKGAVRPEFLPWNYEQHEPGISDFWRDEALVRQYVPDYRFSTWRDIKKKYQIEVFTYNIPEYIRTGMCLSMQTAILFSYRYDKVEYYHIKELGQEG